MKSVYAPHVPSFRNEENPKTLMKDIKEDLHKWRDIPCSWIGRLKMVKTSDELKQPWKRTNWKNFYFLISKLGRKLQ